METQKTQASESTPSKEIITAGMVEDEAKGFEEYLEVDRGLFSKESEDILSDPKAGEFTDVVNRMVLDAERNREEALDKLRKMREGIVN